MEKLKEEIRKALKESATISPVDGGVMMSIVFDKQCDSIMKVVEPLLTADRIVRRLAVLEDNWLSPMNLIHEARTYIATNPNKEGGEGE